MKCAHCKKEVRQVYAHVVDTQFPWDRRKHKTVEPWCKKCEFDFGYTLEDIKKQKNDMEITSVLEIIS